MKTVFKILSLCLLSLTVLSCSESKLLQKGLLPFKESLGYEFTSPVENGPKTDSVVVVYNGLRLDSLTTVKREKTLILPFVFVNYFNYKFRVNLGNSSLADDYNDFFFNALLDESNRSGKFALSYDSVQSKSVYTLEITLDTCETTSLIEMTQWVVYFVYGYSMTYDEYVRPAQCGISCSAVLRKGDQIVYDKKVQAKKTLIFPGGNMRRSDMYPLLSRNLVESLSLCTRDCIAEIVREVNGFLTGNQ